MAIVIQLKTNRDLKMIELEDKPITVGRSRSASVKIEAKFLSRLHLEFSLSATKKIMVQDLDSKNGTLFNKKPMPKECYFYLNDIIEIGELQISIDSYSLSEEEKAILTRPVSSTDETKTSPQNGGHKNKEKEEVKHEESEQSRIDNKFLERFAATQVDLQLEPSKKEKRNIKKKSDSKKQ